MKERYDERQEQMVHKIGSWSFLMMFGMCAAVIVAELMWKGSLELVMGETLVLVAGGAASLAGTVKSGIWTKTGRKMTTGQNLVMSVLFSAVFSVFYAVVISRGAGAGAAAGGAVLIFFFAIAVLGFVVLSALGYFSDRQQKRQERKYGDGK